MAKAERIEHEGKIVDITPDTISVEILNKSACAECHAAGLCAASDQETRIIEIPYSISSLTEEYQVGEKVNVILGSSLAMSAIFIAYVVPLILLILVVTLLSSRFEDLIVGLSAIGVVAIYYIAVYLFRNRLERIFSFSIEKSKQQ